MFEARSFCVSMSIYNVDSVVSEDWGFTVRQLLLPSQFAYRMGTAQHMKFPKMPKLFYFILRQRKDIFIFYFLLCGKEYQLHKLSGSEPNLFALLKS